MLCFVLSRDADYCRGEFISEDIARSLIYKGPTDIKLQNVRLSSSPVEGRQNAKQRTHHSFVSRSELVIGAGAQVYIAISLTAATHRDFGVSPRASRNRRKHAQEA